MVEFLVWFIILLFSMTVAILVGAALVNVISSNWHKNK